MSSKVEQSPNRPWRLVGRRLFETSREAVLLLDAEGTCVDANPAARRLLGEGLAGWSLLDVSGERGRRRAGKLWRRFLVRGHQTGLLSLRAPDGRTVRVDYAATADAAPGLHLAILRDAELFDRSAENRERLAAIVDSSEDAIVSKSLDGTILSWNHGAERLFGYTPEEAVGRNIRMVIPAELQSEEDDIQARIRLGERIRHFETTRVRKDGQKIRVSLSVSAIRNAQGRVVGAAKVARDVTESRRAEAEIRESRERLHLALAASRTGTFRWNVREDVCEAGENLLRLLGRPAFPDPCRLEDLLALVHPEDVETVRAAFAEAATAFRDVEIDFRVVRPARSVLWLYLKARTVTGGDGRPLHLSGACVDVTSRKRMEEALRESEERFRTLADNIAQFAWMADGEGWIFWYNRRWFEFTGTDLESMSGWGWRKVQHPDHIERVERKFRRCIEAGVVWEDTFPLRRFDGTWRWFLSRAVPIRDEAGEVVRWFGTNTDITERMRMEEALRRADRRKDEFLATLAHELRNPLAPIRTGLELLRLADGDPEERRRTRETMERQTAQLVRLVDDLLDVSRITRGKVELRREKVPLAAIVQSSLETTRPLIDANGHSLAVDLPSRTIWLHADPTRLAQVFSNLLNNAARYTPRGGRIQLVAAEENGEVVVSVRDTGVGISADALDQVFDMFTQGEGGRESMEGGLGIGLTLARSLVRLHGGRIRVESEGRDRGSTFHVSLPVLADTEKPRPAGAAVPDAADGGESSRSRVLVVDDNRDAADSLGAVLSATGYEVRVAYSGEQALDLFDEHRPSAVLLDLGMPGLDGIETAQRIREKSGGREAVLVALTGWGQAEDVRRTREAGFRHHLVKPVEPARLRELLDSLPRG